MVSFVPFLVYFMLSWRDHINRSFLQFFHGEDRLIAARSLQGIADMVRAFVVGNFLLGLLLAVLSSVAFWLMRCRIPLLVGPFSGFMSLVPYVGMPLAMIPPLFAALRGQSVLDVHSGGRDGGDAAPDRAEPAVSEDRRLARAPESAGGDVLPDALGLPVDAPGLLLAIPLDGRAEGRLRNVKRCRSASSCRLRHCFPRGGTEATEMSRRKRKTRISPRILRVLAPR